MSILRVILGNDSASLGAGGWSGASETVELAHEDHDRTHAARFSRGSPYLSVLDGARIRRFRPENCRFIDHRPVVDSKR